MGELRYRYKGIESRGGKELPLPLFEGGLSREDIILKKAESLVGGGSVSREEARPVIIALRNSDRAKAVEAIKGLLSSPDPKKIESGIELARVCGASELIPMLRELLKSPSHSQKAQSAIRQLSS